MSRQLTNRERDLRMNIRNAFLVATIEELDIEIERRTDKEDFLAVRFLNELKTEIVAEQRLHPHQYEALAALKNKLEGQESIAMKIPTGLCKHVTIDEDYVEVSSWTVGDVSTIEVRGPRLVCSNLSPRFTSANYPGNFYQQQNTDWTPLRDE